AVLRRLLRPRRQRLGVRRTGAKRVRDLLDARIRVDVADGDDGHAVSAVVRVEEGGDVVARERLDDLAVADDRPLVGVMTKRGLEQRLRRPRPRRILAPFDFLEDDLELLGELFT